MTSSSHQGLQIAFGTAGVGSPGAFADAESLEAAFKVLEQHKVSILDTAQLYGPSEKTLGEAKAGSRFSIDTKWVSGFGGPDAATASKESIIKSAKESLDRLGVSKVDVFYLHAPSAGTPLEETLAGVDEVYKSGGFKRFGLSNFPAAEVERVYEVSKAKGYVLPTVYQANYNPIARKQETILFPTLRRLGLAVYVYSPLAGGFLAKTPEEIAQGAGRFSKEAIGGLYHGLYVKPELVAVLPEWARIAEHEAGGISKSELAYRWVSYHSALRADLGDTIIVGARNTDQLAETLAGLAKGPLPPAAVTAIDAIWTRVEHVAPVDNFNK